MTAFASSSSPTRPLPPGVRLVLAALLAGLLGLYLSAPTLAQQRRPAGKTAAKPASGSGGSGNSGSGYTTALGLRVGAPAGITLKHFFRSSVAVEGIVGTSFNRRGLNVTVLIEKHGPAFQARGLHWYYGLGGHVSAYRGNDYLDWYYDRKGRRRYDPYYDNGRRYWGLGIDGVLGLEYQFRELPFTLGVDLKPTAELVTRETFFWIDPALTLRYVF